MDTWGRFKAWPDRMYRNNNCPTTHRSSPYDICNHWDQRRWFRNESPHYYVICYLKINLVWHWGTLSLNNHRDNNMLELSIHFTLILYNSVIKNACYNSKEQCPLVYAWIHLFQPNTPRCNIVIQLKYEFIDCVFWNDRILKEAPLL